MKPEELSSIKLDISKRHDEICDAAFEYHCRWQNRPPEWRPDIATAFNDGAKWADEHPSEQTLNKAVYLFKRWITNQAGLDKMEFIKKNWNIKIN